MRREGRARGMVRTINILPEPLNPRPTGRVLNRFDTPPTAGLFLKVSSKPTNHSKFTGSGCHLNPGTKSRDKAKGTHKVRSVNNKLTCKVMHWTVMNDDRSDKFPVVGRSASRVLDELYDDDDDGGPYDESYDGSDQTSTEGSSSYVVQIEENAVLGVELEVRSEGDREDDIIIHGGVMEDDDDDGYRGFYDISSVYGAIVVDSNEDDDDEGWYLVGGI